MQAMYIMIYLTDCCELSFLKLYRSLWHETWYRPLYISIHRLSILNVSLVSDILNPGSQFNLQKVRVEEETADAFLWGKGGEQKHINPSFTMLQMPDMGAKSRAKLYPQSGRPQALRFRARVGMPVRGCGCMHSVWSCSGRAPPFACTPERWLVS